MNRRRVGAGWTTTFPEMTDEDWKALEDSQKRKFDRFEREKERLRRQIREDWEEEDRLFREREEALRKRVRQDMKRSKRGGTILGPGNPDGTGPARGTSECPFDEEDDGIEARVARQLVVVAKSLVSQHLENVKEIGPMTERETVRAIRDAIIAEEQAINQYETIVDSTQDERVKEVLQDIANEEKVHVGELQRLLALMLDDEQDFLDEGAEEVDEEAQ